MTTGSGGSLEFARRAELPLFPKEDSPALARLLERFALNAQDRQEVARRAQGVAREHFTFERMMARLLQSLESVAGTARRSMGTGLD
jgi:glycosyltransferase involved in cell wall biosynthesis